MPAKKEKKKPELEGQYCQSNDGFIVRSGKGKHTSADGTIYTGKWENDKMCGIGDVLHPSGASYHGDFWENMMHGHGKYTWPDGSSYEGPFYENKMEGAGEFTDSTGQVWIGDFRNKTATNLKFKLNM